MVLDTKIKEEIAKVVYSEGSVFVGKNYDALLAIAQCVYDQWQSRLFGTDLLQILQKNFSGHSDAVNEECLQAVEDVFVRGKKRFPDAKIYEFRSFSKYSDGHGNIATGRCFELLQKYDYIGKDSISTKWGHFYFGKCDRPYWVQAGAYENRAYVESAVSSLKKANFSPEIVYRAPYYLVIVGKFRTISAASRQKEDLNKLGIDSFVTKNVR